MNRDEIIAAAREAARALGRSDLTRADLTARGLSDHKVMKHFDTWRELSLAAGLKAYEKNGIIARVPARGVGIALGHNRPGPVSLTASGTQAHAAGPRPDIPVRLLHTGGSRIVPAVFVQPLFLIGKPLAAAQLAPGYPRNPAVNWLRCGMRLVRLAPSRCLGYRPACRSGARIAGAALAR